MSSLSTNPKTVASRTRGKNWSEEAKLHYKRQSADRVALSKRLSKLKQSNVWIEVSDSDREAMKENVRDEVERERKEKGLHGNAYR